jgi:hypothetical protein
VSWSNQRVCDRVHPGAAHLARSTAWADIPVDGEAASTYRERSWRILRSTASVSRSPPPASRLRAQHVSSRTSPAAVNSRPQFCELLAHSLGLSGSSSLCRTRCMIIVGHSVGDWLSRRGAHRAPTSGLPAAYRHRPFHRPQRPQTSCRSALFLCAGENTMSGTLCRIFVFDSALSGARFGPLQDRFQAALGHLISVLLIISFISAPPISLASIWHRTTSHGTPTASAHGVTTARHVCLSTASVCHSHHFLRLIYYPSAVARCSRRFLCLLYLT